MAWCVLCLLFRPLSKNTYRNRSLKQDGRGGLISTVTPNYDEPGSSCQGLTAAEYILKGRRAQDPGFVPHRETCGLDSGSVLA